MSMESPVHRNPDTDNEDEDGLSDPSTDEERVVVPEEESLSLRNEDDDEDDEDDEDDDDDIDWDDANPDGSRVVPAASSTEEPPGREEGATTTSPAATPGVDTPVATRRSIGTPSRGGRGQGSSPNILIKAVSTLDRLSGLREIGREALCWQLSSAKPGNGVEQIRDHSVDTYWQSDGNSQPHWVQVHFARRVAISHVCLYLDYSLDESYTPRKVTVQVGMTNQDLIPALHPPATQIELHEPTGWCIIPLSAPPDPLDDCCAMHMDTDQLLAENEQRNHNNVVRAHLVRISILSMHQNGRDTHVRQVQLYGPRMMFGQQVPQAPLRTCNTVRDGSRRHRDDGLGYRSRGGNNVDDLDAMAVDQLSLIR